MRVAMVSSVVSVLTLQIRSGVNHVDLDKQSQMILLLQRQNAVFSSRPQLAHPSLKNRAS
jgi:hypothetical protein